MTVGVLLPRDVCKCFALERTASVFQCFAAEMTVGVLLSRDVCQCFATEDSVLYCGEVCN